MMKKILSLMICIIPSIVGATAKTTFDDWVVNYTCSQTANKLCDGYYKPLTLPPGGIDDGSQPIKVTADAANFIAKGTSIFKGNVVATQGSRLMYADKAEVIHNSTDGELEIISAQGHVKLMQPGFRVDGTKVVAYINENRKTLDDGVYRLYDRHARGTAKSVVILGDSKMSLSNATYTTCAPASNAWHLQANSIDLNKETGRGEAWNAKFYAKDIPIFYFPYINFPIDKRRQTGFLQPIFENSLLNGQTITLPYYFNLAPNYDATVSTSYMTLRSFKFDSIFRYLTKSSNGAINFDFLPDDRAYRALRNEMYANQSFMQSMNPDVAVRRNDLKPRDFRYRFALKNTTYFTRDWLFTVDYTTASDGNYLYDFKPYSASYVTDRDSSIYALQRAVLQNFNRYGILKAQIARYDVFHVVNGPSGTQQLSKMPAIDFNSVDIPLPAGFDFTLNASYINFQSNYIQDSGPSLTYGQRFHVRPALSYPIMRMGWYIIPRAQINYVDYQNLHVSPSDLANGVSPYHPHLTIPMYDLKAGLIFDRNVKFMRRNLLQTLEPQLYYLYVPVKNQNDLPNLDSGLLTFDYNQVFRDNRYTGGDFIGDANQLGMGIASKFFDNETGEEKGMLGVGKIRYFRNQILLLDQELDNTNKEWSPYAFVAKLRLSTDYTIEGNLVTTFRSTDTATFQIQYHPSPVKVINFAYQYVSDSQPDDLTGQLNSNLNQISVSSAWQVSAPWRVLGKVNYDLRFHRYLETIAGFEYHTCCTAMRLVWSRIWMPEITSNHGHDNILRLQIIFKGVGGVGNAPDRYIASVIPGYKASAY